MQEKLIDDIMRLIAVGEYKGSEAAIRRMIEIVYEIGVVDGNLQAMRERPKAGQ